MAIIDGHAGALWAPEPYLDRAEGRPSLLWWGSSRDALADVDIMPGDGHAGRCWLLLDKVARLPGNSRL